MLTHITSKFLNIHLIPGCSGHLRTSISSSHLPLLPSQPSHSFPYLPFSSFQLLDMPTLTQGRLGVLCMFSPFSFRSNSRLSEPIFLAFSLLLSCVAFGISLGLLNDPVNNSNDIPGFSTSDWRQPQPRDHGPQPPLFDATGFRNVMILGTTSSSLNILLSSTL
jgi:hypothetical protein